MFESIKKLFSKPPYVKEIYHDDWDIANPDEPQFVIPKNTHGQGKKPFVSFLEGKKNAVWENDNGDIIIIRNYPIFKGTPFCVKVRISK
jgi:hypothetical protein